MRNLISSSSWKGGGWGGVGEGAFLNAMIPFICLDKNSTELLLCCFSYMFLRALEHVCNYVVAGPGTRLHL